MEGKVLTTRFRLWVILAVFMVIAFLGTQSKIVNAKPVEMTICTGEDINSGVPFSGYYCDCNFKTQYIIPANMISGLKNKYISTMTFYPKKEMEDFDYKTRMCVYLSEVNESSFATKKFYDISGNPVYDGDVSIKNNKVAIELDDFYLYNGGNLLVTFVCYGADVGGDYGSIGFLGKKSEAAALYKLQDEDEDYEMHDFLPKTTFTYCDKSDFVNVRFQDPEGKLISEQNIYKNSMITPPDIFIYGDYYCEGWSLDGQKFDFSKPVTQDTVFTLILKEGNVYLYEDFEDELSSEWLVDQSSSAINDRKSDDTLLTKGEYIFCQDVNLDQYAKLITPQLDMSGAKNAKLSFVYRYTKYVGKNEDFIVKYVDKEGVWHELYKDVYEPSDELFKSDPTTIVLDLPKEACYDGVQFMFYSYAGTDKNSISDYTSEQTSYFDDITIYSIGHDYKYSAKDNVITAVCANDNCISKDVKATLTINAKDVEYTGKAVEAEVKLSDNWTEVNGLVMDFSVEYYQDGNKLSELPVNIGKYTAKVTINGATASADFEIKQNGKKVNTLRVKPKTATIKYNKLKKKTQKLAATKVIKFVNKGQGKLSYKLVSAKKGKKNFKKYIKVNSKTGKVTVKKGLKKGIYKVKIKVKAAGNAKYKASSWKTLIFKIKVK